VADPPRGRRWRRRRRGLRDAAAEVTVVLHVPDHSFDGGSAPEFALDDAEDSASLSRDEDAPSAYHGLPNAACGTVPASSNRSIQTRLHTAIYCRRRVGV